MKDLSVLTVIDTQQIEIQGLQCISFSPGGLAPPPETLAFEPKS